MEAIVAAKLPTWRLQHLGLWVDLVDPPAAASVDTGPADLMELEDQANAAKYRELRAKIAQDQAAMTSYHVQLEEGKRRSHVVNIMHERGQAEVGKQLLVPILILLLPNFVLILLPPNFAQSSLSSGCARPSWTSTVVSAW